MENCNYVIFETKIFSKIINIASSKGCLTIHIPIVMKCTRFFSGQKQIVLKAGCNKNGQFANGD